MLMCREFIQDHLADYLEGTLSREVVAELEGHLKVCAPCVAYLRTYQKTRELVGRAGQVEMPAEMRSILRRFLQEKLTKEKS